MNMRERLAKILSDADGMHPDAVSNDEDELPVWTTYLGAVDAVLDALMKPTDGMLDLGDHAYNLTGISGASGFPDNSEEHTAFIWQAMIQAARDGK